jgi:hypothetical protein
MAVKVLQKIMALIVVGQMAVHFPPMLPEGAHENFTVLGSMRVFKQDWLLSFCSSSGVYGSPRMELKN